MTFASPELLWLSLLAPLATAMVLWLWRRRLAAATAWAARGLWDRLLPTFDRRRLLLSTALLSVALLGTSLALARPRWGQGEEEIERRGIDLVFVLDTSLSMGARDVKPSRLGAARTLVRRLLDRLPGNRVALVQAEGSGEVLAPLTVDAAAIDLLLDAAEPGSLPTPGTELADALGDALELFDEGEPKHRVIVLLSDGEDHGGGVSGASERLAEAGVVAHVLGVGTRQGARVPLPGGGPGEVKRHEDEVVISRLREGVLEDLARRTGGVYLQATGPALDLEPVAGAIAGMEKRALARERIAVLEERFQWPLALAVAFLTLHLAIGPFAPAVRSAEGRR